MLAILGLESRGGSENSDSVLSSSLASPNPPFVGEPKKRGNEEHGTKSRGHLQRASGLGRGQGILMEWTCKFPPI